MFNSFMPNGNFYLHYSDRSISDVRVSGYFLIMPCFIEFPVFNANSVDPDPAPRSAATDLGLHCFANALLMGR